MNAADAVLVQLLRGAAPEIPAAVLDRLQSSGYVTGPRAGVELTDAGRNRAKEITRRGAIPTESRVPAFNVVTESELIAISRGFSQ